MRRRAILHGVAVLAFVVQLSIAAQTHAQSSAQHRIGILSATGAGLQQSRLEAMLAEVGYVEGKTASFIRGFADGRRERLPDLAAGLLAERVEIILTMSTSASLAAKRATDTIPIVVVSTGDAVALGLAESLERPGGNVTGNSFLGAALASAQLGVLQQMVPKLERVAFLGNGLLLVERRYLEQLERAGAALGLAVAFIDTRRPADFERGFAAIAALQASAVIVAPGGNYYDHRARLVALAASHRVPALYFRREYVEEGGLLSYGTNWREMYGRAAAYADRILKGVRPADLPMLQPASWSLIVNRKTASALGLEVPKAVREEAEEVIE